MRVLEKETVSLAIDASIKDAIVKLNQNFEKILIVLNEHDEILCIITDGDIRRAILNDNDLEKPALDIGNKSPLIAQDTLSENQIHNMMEQNNIEHIPVVDKNNKVKFLYRFGINKNYLIKTAVIMAGGLGERMRPLTETVPKPLMDIAGKPILERIIDHLVEHGITRILITVNYLAQMIKDKIGDGGNFGITIEYIQENEKLGTAGSLSLLKDKIKDDFFVLNADISTKVNLCEFSQKHYENNCVASIAVANNEVQIPYGVVSKKENGDLSWVEKPIYNYFVAVGIYIFANKILEGLPQEPEYQDMPELLMKLQNDDQKLNMFPLYEPWSDIGTISDLNKLRRTFFSD